MLKKFDLAGIRWTVQDVEVLPALGMTYPDLGIIHIKRGLDEQMYNQTFLHELTHAILFTMGKRDGHDEEFIEGFSQLLHQFMRQLK